MEALSEEKILKACCGERHSLALTVCGKVFSWGFREGMPHKSLDGTRRGFYICDIAAGNAHSAALSSHGDVFMWGDGQDYCTLQRNQDYLYVPTPAKLLP